ncbi:hypothetical protein [Streptomyces sp. NPDC048277]|uniref:hypothetical protein n=1 Tax=Streptomyces sp. NPDC048277 TaxID=3155027 RepID=UPI0033EE823C
MRAHELPPEHSSPGRRARPDGRSTARRNDADRAAEPLGHAGLPSGILALQRSAGNGAVARGKPENLTPQVVLRMPAQYKSMTQGRRQSGGAGGRFRLRPGVTFDSALKRLMQM